MTVEERRHGGSTSGDKFPVGLRVLAVDDDRACLKILDGLLRRCQYHVTTTNQAIDALNLLRSEKARFDLVISDVHMPDMDGFKLLELVGLEMDLPVIMLSANSDPKSVMKGIAHGACDYLLKPVRLEELKNIWQHVVRRKKFDCSDTVPVIGTKSGDRTRLGRRKRKDSGDGCHNDNDESEEDVHDNIDDDEDDYDSSSSVQQKKPRVVWSVDLHRKFVAAVHHLGIDKAMPKRILDLMNVQKLTRENVASHLQKYRLYLKRISTVSTATAQQQQSVFPNIDASLHLRQDGGIHTISNYNSAVGSGYYNNNLGSSGIIQLDHRQLPQNHNLHNLSFSGAINQPHPNLVHDMPSSSSINLHHYRHTAPPLQMNRSLTYDSSKLYLGNSFNENPSNSSTQLLPQPHNMAMRIYPENNPFGRENVSSKSKNVVVATFPEDRDRDVSFGSNCPISMSLPAGGALSISDQTWQQRLSNDPIPITNSTYSNNINVNPPTQAAQFGNGDDDRNKSSNSCFIDDIPTAYTENCNNIEVPETCSKDEPLQWNFTGDYEPFDDLISTISKQVEDIW